MDHVPDLRGGYRETVKFLLVPVISAAVFIAGIVWQAARYPTRAEFEIQRDEIARLRIEYAEVKANTSAIKETVGRIERRQENGFSEKLDVLITRRRQ